MPLTLDVIKWNASGDMFAAKFQADDIAKYSRLIVAESQEAVFVLNGRYARIAASGMYPLDDKEHKIYPFLSDALGIAYGGRIPSSAEVWFVNKAIKLDVKWGTATPIQLKDPMHNVMLPIRAFGQFGITVCDAGKFLKNLVGTLQGFDAELVSDYFRGVLMTRIKDVIAKRIVKERISLLEISAHLSEICADLQAQLAPEFDEFGLKFVKFSVASINTPEDDSSVLRLKGALEKRAELDILGTTYQQVSSFDVMKTAAGNEGAGMMTGPMMGAGMGMGMGATMGAAFGQVAAHVAPAAVSAAMLCISCQAPLAPGATFCAKCGARGGAACASCNAPLLPDARFCPKCGASAKKVCAGCKADLPTSALFCPKCGVRAIE